jgi:hypothetical protein
MTVEIANSKAIGRISISLIWVRARDKTLINLQVQPDKNACSRAQQSRAADTSVICRRLLPLYRRRLM